MPSEPSLPSPEVSVESKSDSTENTNQSVKENAEGKSRGEAQQGLSGLVEQQQTYIKDLKGLEVPSGVSAILGNPFKEDPSLQAEAERHNAEIRGGGKDRLAGSIAGAFHLEADQKTLEQVKHDDWEEALGQVADKESPDLDKLLEHKPTAVEELTKAAHEAGKAVTEMAQQVRGAIGQAIEGVSDLVKKDKQSPEFNDQPEDGWVANPFGERAPTEQVGTATGDSTADTIEAPTVLTGGIANDDDGWAAAPPEGHPVSEGSKRSLVSRNLIDSDEFMAQEVGFEAERSSHQDQFRSHSLIDHEELMAKEGGFEPVRNHPDQYISRNLIDADELMAKELESSSDSSDNSDGNVDAKAQRKARLLEELKENPIVGAKPASDGGSSEGSLIGDKAVALRLESAEVRAPNEESRSYQNGRHVVFRDGEPATINHPDGQIWTRNPQENSWHISQPDPQYPVGSSHRLEYDFKADLKVDKESGAISWVLESGPGRGHERTIDADGKYSERLHTPEAAKTIADSRVPADQGVHSPAEVVPSRTPAADLVPTAQAGSHSPAAAEESIGVDEDEANLGAKAPEALSLVPSPAESEPPSKSDVQVSSPESKQNVFRSVASEELVSQDKPAADALPAMPKPTPIVRELVAAPPPVPPALAAEAQPLPNFKPTPTPPVYVESAAPHPAPLPDSLAVRNHEAVLPKIQPAQMPAMEAPSPLPLPKDDNNPAPHLTPQALRPNLETPIPLSVAAPQEVQPLPVVPQPVSLNIATNLNSIQPLARNQPEYVAPDLTPKEITSSSHATGPSPVEIHSTPVKHQEVMPTRAHSPVNLEPLVPSMGEAPKKEQKNEAPAVLPSEAPPAPSVERAFQSKEPLKGHAEVHHQPPAKPHHNAPLKTMQPQMAELPKASPEAPPNPFLLKAGEHTLVGGVEQRERVNFYQYGDPNYGHAYQDAINKLQADLRENNIRGNVSGVDRDDMLSWEKWHKAVGAKINQNWSHGAKAFNPGMNGLSAEFSFTVNPSGQVVGVELTQGSGNPAYDVHCANALLKGGLKFPPSSQRGNVKYDRYKFNLSRGGNAPTTEWPRGDWERVHRPRP